MHPSPALFPPKLIWWVCWIGILIGLTFIHGAIPTDPATAPTEGALRNLPLIPLLISSALRWVVLPRITRANAAFVVFIVGLALAEAGSVIGLFLVPELRPTYFALGVFGVLQYAPLFLRRFDEPAKP